MLYYKFSELINCLCLAKELYDKGYSIERFINKHKSIIKDNDIKEGRYIEKRYEEDENGYLHIKTINHCKNCNNNII